MNLVLIVLSSVLTNSISAEKVGGGEEMIERRVEGKVQGRRRRKDSARFTSCVQCVLSSMNN